MDRNELLKTVTEIARDVFENEQIELSESTTAADVEGWDSLTHLGFLNEIELEFQVKFTLAQIQNLKDIGELLDVLQAKIG